jgi:putative flavoprotein involved in K+ transport
VVIATGACNVASVPKVAAAVPAGVRTLTAMEYRNPDQLAPGGVLVVGASATGTQLAQEIHRSGRPVTMAVGEHIRAPRIYRGRDIQWWMDVAGVHDQRYDEVDDIVRARRVPSLQLTGSPDRTTLDLNALTGMGVKLVGRLAGIHDGKAQFSGSLRNQCALSDLKMTRLLDTIDEWARDNGLDGEVEPPHRFVPTEVEDSPPLSLDLKSGAISTVLWATGFRPDYQWLDVPVLDRKGAIRHDGGIVPSPGLYLMGMQFLRRRKSALIDGAGDDARDLCDHLAAYLDGRDVGRAGSLARQLA